MKKMYKSIKIRRKIAHKHRRC